MKSGAFAKPFFALSGLGFLGVLCLLPFTLRAVPQLRQMPGVPDLPDLGIALLLLVQPAILLLAAVAIGVALAGKAGLTSLILRSLRGQHGLALEGWGSTLALALLFASLVAAADLVFRQAFPQAFAGLPRMDEVTLAGRLLALLYGGVTEELMMRFGLMSLLLWLGLRLTKGRGREVVTWIAIVLAAIAFAAGHLGLLAGMAQADQGILVVRTLLLNSVLGVLFGWLYARRSLEHAMLAHAASHVVFWIVTPLLVALGL